MARRRTPLAAAASLALLFAGCGASTRPATPLSAEQRAVTSANEICSEYLAFARVWAARAGTRPGKRALARLLLVKRSAARRRHAALLSAAGQPRVHAYLADLAERERALRELRRLAGGSGPLTANPSLAAPIDRLYVAASRTYAAANALGLSGCTGTQPRKPAGGRL